MDSVFIHEIQQILLKLPYCERPAPSRRFSMSAGVDRIYVIVPGKLTDLPLEIAAVLSVSVKQDDRIALALFYEKMLNIHVEITP